MTSTLPPTSFSGAISFGRLGEVDPTTGLFRSAYLSSQWINSTYWPTIYYQFESSGGYVAIRTDERPSGSSAFNIYDDSQDYKGNTRYADFYNLNFYEISNNTTYLQGYTGYSSAVSYDLGLMVVPADPNSYSDKSELGDALELGVISHQSLQGVMYTLYDRVLPSSSSSKTMQVDMNNALVRDQTESWDFTLNAAGKLKITLSGQYGSALLVDHNGFTYKTYEFEGTRTFDVRRGEFTLTLVDSEWSGAGIGVRSADEIYEQYEVQIDLTEYKPNLACNLTGIDDKSLKPGQQVIAHIDFTNDGGRRVNNIEIDTYLSKDAKIEPGSDRHLYGFDIDGINADTTDGWKVWVTVPAKTKPGTYFFGIEIEQQNTETQWFDNFDSMKIQVLRGGRVVFLDDHFSHAKHIDTLDLITDRGIADPSGHQDYVL
jgi:hypothetical protein